MARPIKQGLDYYNTETDIFSNRKIKRLISQYGGDGYLIYSYILSAIYKNGHYIVFDEDMIFDIGDTLKLEDDLIIKVVDFCTIKSLFNLDVFLKYKILTSKNIQGRWLLICKNARRKNLEINDKCNLLGVNADGPELMQGKTELMQGKTELMQVESTQRKVKKSKVKETKVNINSNKPKNQKNDFKTLVLNFNDDIKNCYQNCKNEFPEHLQPKTNKILFNWLSVIDKLNRIDKLPFSEIERIVKGIRNDSFWSKQFLSLTKLRKNDKNNVKYIVVFNEYLKYSKKEKKITGAESFKNAMLKQLQDEQYTDI